MAGTAAADGDIPAATGDAPAVVGFPEGADLGEVAAVGVGLCVVPAELGRESWKGREVADSMEDAWDLLDAAGWGVPGIGRACTVHCVG